MSKENATQYKFDSYWSEHDGWHFSFGNKRLWESTPDCFIVAELNEDNIYSHHEKFDKMEDALHYMRTGDVKNSRRIKNSSCKV